MFNVNKQIVAFTVIVIAFLLYLILKNIDLSKEICASNEQLCLI
jgi:hypothetical protein